MSSRKSKLRKTIRAANRLQDRQAKARDKYRLPGETDEEMEARMKRDLFGFLDMMEEREIEQILVTEAEKQKIVEDLQSTEVSTDDIVVEDLDTNEEN